MSTERLYTSRRMNIIESLVKKLKDIDGSGAYLMDVNENVHPRLQFWDEIEEFPAIHLNAGSETRDYQAGGYKDRFLSVTVRCYVNEEDANNIIKISNSFGIKAQIIGKVEAIESGKKLTIHNGSSKFIY